MRCAGHRSWQELAREDFLHLAMLALSGVYEVLFLAAMLPNRTFSYLASHPEGLSSVLLAYLQLDWLSLILLAVLIVRFGLFVFSSGQLDPMWDPLAVGALAYLACLIALRINSGYYTAPVDLIAILYLASMSLVWLSRPAKFRVSVVAIAFICVLLQDAVYSSFRIIERKNVIISKSKLAEFLYNYSSAANGRTVELFFPYANGYRLMGLSSYLRYKGFRLIGQSVTGLESSPSLVIEGHEPFDDNRCIGYRDYACFHEESARAGALIVVLPDDNASMSDVENIGMDSTLLLSLKAPGVCTREGSWFRSLHAISPQFSRAELPEHLLQLHVFLKGQ
jgi:hypothetical protein